MVIGRGSFLGGSEETSPLPPSKGEMRRASRHEQYDVGTGESASRTGNCGTGRTGETSETSGTGETSGTSGTGETSGTSGTGETSGTGGSASRTGDYGTSGTSGTGETGETGGTSEC